jgi:GTP pyrophosphokinase
MATSITELIKKIEEYNKDPQGLELVRRAYNFSNHAHVGQKRKSGEPFIAHPVHVALILTQIKMDAATIAAALMHDTVEDTKTSLKDVEQNFGAEIAALVDGVTKLSSISFTHKHEAQAESFRKMLLAMAKDIRVIIIKLADRTHNMRTLKSLSEEKQRLIAQETLDIYAPLANRLGISWLKVELEDQALLYLKPMIYHRLSNQVTTTSKWREKYIQKVMDLLTKEMKRVNLVGAVSGRHKHLYSIYRKMEKRGLDFDEVTDILAFRIVVDSVHQCYEALGMVHSLWKPVPGKFKDYIAIPKVNMYQSLHTTVTGPDGERVEIQIRTKEMHQIAEEGIAAHWMYKENKGFSINDQSKFQWLRSMVDWEQDFQDSTDFIESVKLDLFEDQVYVFTPKGDVRELPRGSTPIDFAYSIHTEVGNHCTGARVNSKMVPLRYKLQNGDRIEINTTEAQKPNEDWLKIAVTSRAKAKIRAYLRTDERVMGISMGTELLEQELAKFHRTIKAVSKENKLQLAAQELNYRSPEDLLMAIGFGKVSLGRVLNKLLPPEVLDKAKPEKPSLIDQIIDKVGGKVGRKSGSTIKVGGADDILVRLGRCCNPIPGDAIAGFITRGRGVTVHRAECRKVLELTEERRIDVEWDKKTKVVHQARIRVFSSDTPGVLANLSKVISQAGVNIAKAQVSTTIDKKAMQTFQVELHDTSELYNIIKAIEKVNGVISVERLRS